MRKQVKNKKVLQAITIGLAAVITATSIPMNTYAATEGSQGEGGSEQNQQPEQSQTEQSQTEVQIVTAVEIIDGTAAEAGALELIADADKKVDTFADTFNLTDAGANKDIQTDLENAANYIADKEGTGVETKVGDTVYNDGAKKDLKEAKNLVTAGFEAVDNVNEAMEDAKGVNLVFDNTGKINRDVDSNGKNDLIEEMQGYADSANATDDYTTAYGYQSKAQTAYNIAATDLEQAKIKYNEALEAKKVADAIFDAANERIEHAQVNSAAAYNALEDAKSKLPDLQKDSAEKQRELEAIQKQYYALQVQYYRLAGVKDTEDRNRIDRDGLDHSKTADGKNIFEQDGKLNVDNAAQWLVENNYVQDAATKKGNETEWKIGRYLMKELIVAKLKNEGVDPDTIHVGEYFKGAASKGQEAVEVDVHKNEYGGDQVIKGSIIPEEYISQKETFYRASTNVEDNGETNRFAVTYTKNGETVTEYYNYIFKNPNTNLKEHTPEQINEEMEKGPIYLAQIVPDLDENGVQKTTINQKTQKKELLWKTVRVDGANDNYKELVNVINQYSEAQSAVEAAQDKVKQLQKEIKNVQRVGKIPVPVADSDLVEWRSVEEFLEGDYDPEVLMTLSDSNDPYTRLIVELKIAKQELGTAQENVDKAKEILDSIDLSRFGGNDDTTGGDDTTVIDGGDVVVTIPGGAGIDAINLTGITGFNNGQVLGARDIRNNTTNIADGRVPLAGNIQASNNKQNNSVIANKKNTTKIKDNEIPLAEIPNKDNEVTMNWMWLLIIFLLGATGKKMYDEYKKKKEAEEAAKLNK